MASFRQQYEAMFGKQADFDPISPSPVDTQAEELLDAAPTASPSRKRTALPMEPLGPRPQDAESGFMGNVAKQFGAGVVQTGEMLLGAGEYGARQFDLTDGIVADTIYSGRQGLAGVREDILAGISEEDRQKAAAEILTLDPNRTIWQGNPLDVAESIIYKTANALPASLVTMIPAIRWARAASPGTAIAYMGATEGTMSVGGIANGIADEINSLSSEQLLQESPRFAELLEQYGNDADEAKNALIAEAQGFAPLVGGATVAAISSVAGRYFTPIFEKGAGAALGGRAARGFAAEAPQEGSQGAAEQLVQNYAARVYDADRQLSEGVAEAAAQEALIGGAMGAGAGAMFGQRPPPPTPPAPETDPTADITVQPDLPGFEPGGRLPDELDQPSPEPVGDLIAQIEDLQNPQSSRQGVYIPPGQDERSVAAIERSLPEELVFLRNVDGQGGHMITASAELALEAQKRIASGASRQEVIGAITGAGRGKPTDPNSRVVQLLNEQGAVIRESMVASQEEAQALGQAWDKEGVGRVAIMSPREAVERREVLGQDGGAIPVQEDMFDNRAARGTDFTIPPRPPLDEPIQGDLPLTMGRARGVGRVPMPGPEQFQGPQATPYQTRGGEQRIAPPPGDIEDPEAGPDPYEISRRQYGMDFEDPGVETVTQSRRRRRQTGRYLVRLYDDSGEVVSEEAKDSVEEANATADEWAESVPDGNIQVVPETKTQIYTAAENKPRETKPLEPIHEPSIEEEVQQDIRSNLPFDERIEPIAKTKGVRSYGQASDRLIGEAAAAYDEEQKARIGGFYHPDRLEFSNPEYEKSYRETWGQLVEAELVIEVSGQARAVERAKKRRQALLQELGKVRQISKPKLSKGKSERFFEAARAVNPAAVREFEKTAQPTKEGIGGPKGFGTATPLRDVEEDYLGEFKGGTREQIDNLAEYSVRHKTPKGKEWEAETGFKTAKEAYARQEELQKKYPKRSVVVDVKATRALDEEFERAVLFREGREADTRKEPTRKAAEREEAKQIREEVLGPEEQKAEPKKPAPLTGKLELTEQVSEEGEFVEAESAEETPSQEVEYTARVDREEYRTPGQRLKFIRREAEHKRRLDTGQKSIKATPVRRSAGPSRIKTRTGESEQSVAKRTKKAEEGKKFDTQPLTVETYKLDESVADRVKRQAAAKRARGDVGKAATKAGRYLRGISEKGVYASVKEAHSDKIAKEFLYAREYLKQLIEFARSIQASKSESNQSIKLAEGVAKMLGVLEAGVAVDRFAMDWGAVARKNEFDDLSNLKFTSLAAMRDPKARARADRETLNKLKNKRALREINTYLRQDQLYQRLIFPTIDKMVGYFERASLGQSAVPYIPNEAELAEIRYAMQTLKNNWSPARLADMGENMQREFAEFAVDTKVNVYEPLRRRMEEFGFEFDESGNLSGFQASERYLGPRFKERMKGQKEIGAAELERSMEQWTQKVRAVEGHVVNNAPVEHTLKVQQPAAEQTVEEAIAAMDRRKSAMQKGRTLAEDRVREVKPGLLTIDAVNGLLERFKKATASSKTTISGIQRQEARFIRGLKQLGVWRQTSPTTGVIDIPTVKAKTYRLVSARIGKTMQKAEARDYIQRVVGFPVPKDMLADVRAARKDAETVAGLERFLDRNTVELFNEAAGPVRYDAEYTGVAESIGDRMVAGDITADDVVNTILEIAPQNSFYRNLADRLKARDMSSVKIGFGVAEDFPTGQLGKYNRKTNRILLNRDALSMDRLQADEAYGARVVHTLTHEMVHAVTHKAIDESPRLRQYFEALQHRGREAWQENVGGTLPYGLKLIPKSQNQAHEFVAEAFSNHEFQQFLKDTPLQPKSGFDLWKAMVKAVRFVLQLPEQAPNNLFDAILLTEDILFDDAGFGGSVEGELYITGDGVIDNVSTHVQGLARRGLGIADTLRNAGRNLMTFEQLRDTYVKYFDTPAGNPFSRYMDSWSRRNAAISKHMKVPESLSTRWTQLEATDPEGAQEISRIGTAATIDKLSPSRELTAEQRASTSKERLAKYDALRARLNALTPEARQVYKDITAWYRDAQKDEAELLMSASLRGVLTAGRNAPLSRQEFEARFTRERVAAMKDAASIKAELADIISEDEITEFATNLKRMAQLRTIGVGDYFPLMRYGDYVVYAQTEHPDQFFSDTKDAHAKRAELLEEDPTLDVGVFERDGRVVLRVTEKEFWMFENKTEAAAKRAELQNTYQTVSPIQARLSSATEESAISSNAALTSILKTLSGNPAATAAIKNYYLRSLSDQSFRKHELKRKNRRGVNYDIQHRNLANYLKQSAYYRAQLEHGWRMGEALSDMVEFSRKRADTPDMPTERLQQVVKNVQARDRMTNDADELNKWVRKGVNVTQFMMLTSPSYWMINATQPWLVTAPIMGGKYGMGNSYAALKDAMGLVKAPLTKEAWDSKFGYKALTDPVATEKAFNVVDQLLEHLSKSKDPRAGQYIELIDELRDINIIDINVLTELRQIAEGVEGKLGTKVLDASRILAHLTEVNNRVVTAIAAYNLALNNGESVAAAKKYAADMVSQTQFNYSSDNKPPLFQAGGPLKWAAPLMFQFMQWPQHMYALLIRNVHAAVKHESPEVRRAALKSLAGLLTTHAAVGGIAGMALQPIKWALGMLMFAFGDEDEPYTFANAINGRTFDTLLAETANELFGDTAGRAVSQGLPTLLGTDLSARMSMGTLYFVDLRGDTAESVLGSLVASFGGATLNQAMNWGNALGKAAEGDVYRGVEQAMPKIIRDVMRANRYYNEGLINNAGDTVIPTKDLSFGEVFLQGIGFQPDEVSRFYQGQAAIKGAQGYARDRREGLIRSFVDDGSTTETLRKVLEFNRAYPSLRITRSTLIRGARAQIEREHRYKQFGANIDAAEARDFSGYADPYRK